MTDDSKNGWWEEEKTIWMSDWPYEDNPAAYEQLNNTLPDDLRFMPLYSADRRVKLMRWYEE